MFNIPSNSILMLDGGWVKKRLIYLLSKTESELSEINRKEIEVIRYWDEKLLKQNSVSIHALQKNISGISDNDILINFVKKLNVVDRIKSLGVLKLMFGDEK